MVVMRAASGRAGTPAAAVATSSPHRLAPAASPISTPNRRRPCGVSWPGLTSELTSPVRVPVRNVVDTLVSPISLTAAACTPMAAASTASRQNCAHPVGLAPVISHPTVNPASRMSSAASAQLTWAGSTLARSWSSPAFAVPASARLAFPRSAALKPCAVQVPVATPMMYPASETAVWLASDSDPRATARPHSTMLPVMTLVKTPPSRVKLATSFAPDAKVSAIAISVRICCLDLVCISIAATRSGRQAGRNSRPTSSGMSVRRKN